MFIVDYERGEIVNIDNSISIFVDAKRIYAIATDRNIILGEYKTPDRAKEVFAEMLEKVFPPDIFICQNCEMADLSRIEEEARKTAPFFIQTKDGARIERFNVSVYYMPEE